MDIARPTSVSVQSAAPSLYLQTMTTIEQLYSIKDFEFYLFPEGIDSLMEATDGNPMIDPIAVLWGCFRLGAPLCHLLNQLRLEKQLDVPDVSGLTTYNNTCKKCVYHFLICCKETLKIPEEQLFSISELYKDDTNGFVKILKAVNVVIAELYSRKLFPPIKKLPFAKSTETRELKDNRSKIIDEILTTERKYTHDLQALHAYQTELIRSGLVSKDIIIKLFSNLNELLDFQRRFLIAMEATLALDLNNQRLGALFVSNEDAFAVYEPFCSNYQSAIQDVTHESALLQNIGSIDPIQLQSYLIKPVQRVCKYPLLINELIKYTPADNYPYMNELKQALDVVKRITERVNEQQRMDENKKTRANLLDWVVEWRGFDINGAGELMLTDKFNMSTPDGDKEYHVFLFAKVLLCFKDVSKKVKRKKTSSEIPSYGLRGNIYISSIVEVGNQSKPSDNVFTLRIYWRDNSDMESFSLKCRNMEQVILWKQRIDRLLDQEKEKKRSSKIDEQKIASYQGNSAMRYSQADMDSIKSSEENNRNSTFSTRSITYSSPDSRVLNPTSPSRHRAPSFSQEGGHPRVISMPAPPPILRNMKSGEMSPTPLSADALQMDKWSSAGSHFFATSIGNPASIVSNVNPSIIDQPTKPLPSTSTTNIPIRRTSRAALISDKITDSFNKLNLELEKSNQNEEPAMNVPTIAPPLPPGSKNPSLTSLLTNTNGMPLPPGSPSNRIFIKVKIYYLNEILIVPFSTSKVSLADLLGKVERKIKLVGVALPEQRALKLRYKDQDGDMIQIYSDEDVELAFDEAKSGSNDDRGIVHIYAE